MTPSLKDQIASLRAKLAMLEERQRRIDREAWIKQQSERVASNRAAKEGR